MSDPNETLKRLNLEGAPERWREGWDESQSSMPDPIPFLRERYVFETCGRIGLAERHRAALVGALRLFEDAPLWKRIAWHQHRLLFGAGVPAEDSPGYWPCPESDKAASLYPVLILLSGVPNVFEHHAIRGVSPEVTAATLSDLGVRLDGFRETRGYYGLESYRWLAHHFAGRLYQLGRLQFQMEHFPHALRAYRNGKTRRVVLLAESGLRFRGDGLYESAIGGEARDMWTSELVEDERSVRGTAISPLGRAVRGMTTLDKEEWSLILRKGGPVWDTHIPATGQRMDFAECGESVRSAVRFAANHFPEHGAMAFTCYSWLLDPQFEQYLSPSSNIVRFLSEFYLFPVPMAGPRGVANRVFGGRMDNLDELPQDTSLRRAVVKHLKSGGHWHNGGGLQFPEDLDWGKQTYRRVAMVQPLSP